MSEAVCRRAMVAHDPSKAPIAKDVRFTEQTQVKTIGDGLWKTASEGPTTFKVYVAAAHIIKVGDRKIHEIEATGAVLPFNAKNGWSDFLR